MVDEPERPTGTPGAHVVSVPPVLAIRVEALVAAGEYKDFQTAALAMIGVGLAVHDRRPSPPTTGPPPPALFDDIPPPGQPGPGAPPMPPSL